MKERYRQGFLAQGYVDLGLPSGTLWKNINETGCYDYEESILQFGRSLPSKTQMVELVNHCRWEWSGWYKDYRYYKVIGPNGNSIILPVEGFVERNSGKNYGDGQNGVYWSYSKNELGVPFRLSIYRDYCPEDNDSEKDRLDVTDEIYNVYRNSVRLVQTID